MTSRSTYQHESFEQRVLTALAMGASTPEEIAAGLTESPERVRQTLEWAVGAEAVSRLDLPGRATYSLTPKGQEIVGLAQGSGGAGLHAPSHGVVDLPPAPPTGIASVAGTPQVDRVMVDPARRKVQWRHVVYAAAYVLLGLFLLRLQPVVGVVAVVAGLALGAWSLRPLLARETARTDGS